MFQNQDSTIRLSHNLNETTGKNISVFHPTDSLLNVVLIISHSVKFMLILLSISFALFVGKTGDYPDEDFYIYKYERSVLD